MFREKKGCFQACVIVSELDDPSGHRDFPWLALHCNFQGLVAESNSVRDPGNGGPAKRPATSVCSAATERLLLKQPRRTSHQLPLQRRIEQCTEPLAGAACGCTNDRRWLH